MTGFLLIVSRTGSSSHSSSTPPLPLWTTVLTLSEPRCRRHDLRSPDTSGLAAKMVIILILDNKIDLYSVGRRNNESN